MKALILAAGLGTRMRPLTDTLPKPLLQVGGKPLIAYHLERLAAAGIRDVAVNASYRAAQLAEYLGDGARWHLDLQLSQEAQPLETGGGILQAMRLLEVGADDSLLVVNGDVWTDYPLERLRAGRADLAQLVLVENPEHNPAGDFGLRNGRVCGVDAGRACTFSGLSLLKGRLFERCQPGIFPLAPLLREAIAAGLVGGEYYAGRWVDVGTPQRLAELDLALGGQDYQEYLREARA